MTSLASLLADVYVITNRPDLVSESTIAVRKATIKCHGADLFEKDLAQQIVTLSPLDTPDDFRYQIDLSASPFARVRQIHYIYEHNIPLTGTEKKFLAREADSILNDYRTELQDYYYVIGSQINMRGSKSYSRVRVGYYQVPDTASNTYSSWIADLYPDIIIEEACAAVFKMIGKDEEAASYRKLFEENIAILRMMITAES